MIPTFLGAKIAQYAGKHLHKFILQRPEYKEGSIPDAMKQVWISIYAIKILLCVSLSKIYLSYAVKGFLDVDTAMLEDEALKDEMAGTTAVSILIKNNSLYCVSFGI